MNFKYSEEQLLLKQSIERWAQDNYSFEQRQSAAEKTDGFSREHWATFAQLGWLSVPFAEELGGYGGSVIDLAAIMEEFGKALVVEPMVPNLLMFGGLLSQTENTGLRDKLIPSIIDGSLFGAVASYEPQSRYDLSNIACSAENKGDTYALNGTKSLVLGGAYADKIIIAARTSGEQTDQSGIDLFLVESSAEGLAKNAYKLMDGQRVVDLQLTDVTVGSDQLLSTASNGFQMLQLMQQHLHIALSAEALGIMQRLNTATVEYTKTRKQFGVQISQFQALQHRMVDTFMAYELCKSMLVGTLCEMTDGVTDAVQINKSLNGLRTLIARSGKLIGDEAIQLHGGMGMTDELDVGHYVKRLLMINLMFGNGDFFQTQYNQLAYA